MSRAVFGFVSVGGGVGMTSRAIEGCNALRPPKGAQNNTRLDFPICSFVPVRLAGSKGRGQVPLSQDDRVAQNEWKRLWHTVSHPSPGADTVKQRARH